MAETIEAIHELSDYAHARGLNVADEMLTELLARIYVGFDPVALPSFLAEERSTASAVG
ncbi:hypothetical protein [Muricoccus radiodurans]|uniref:hypothetical protein n=1 Tax=Muricoccus radiodurans TaxID=2231721 RepID=UPI003CF8AAB5